MRQYYQMDKGVRNCYLMRDNIAIAYTDDSVIKITKDFDKNSENDNNALFDFADEYDLEIEF